MSGETEILAALFAASMGVPGEVAPGSEPARWEDFLARLAEATLAESALLRLSWPGSPMMHCRSGCPGRAPQRR
ncbi:hypothetical protein AYJ57_25285 (plasmid) [Salipiger sp. CCB-MM3]|nr:hypothetical protein AYJ57_25285 [Salipiger sp. CCB-MM3]